MALNIGRLLRSPAMRTAMIRGAGIGAGVGAAWGMASDNTSLVGGAFKGALAGVALGGGFKGMRMLRSPARRAAARAAGTAANIGPRLAANTNASGQVIYGATLEEAMNAQIRRNIPRIPGQPYPAPTLPNWRMPPIATRRR